MTIRVDCLGTQVSVLSFDGAQQALQQLVQQQRGCYVSPATVYSLMLARERADYLRIVNQAAIVTADGMPVVWLQRLFGQAGAERVHNDDLWFAYLARYPGQRHYLVGGRIGQPQAVAQALTQRYPGIQVVGMQPTPRRPVPPEQTEQIVAEIVASGADVVWVGLGTPEQDRWMHAVHQRIGRPLVGVGSAFDLLAGQTRAAPEWMKRNGLQWLFRLVQEPRRLAWRYLNYNTRFIVAATGQWLQRWRQGGARP